MDNFSWSDSQSRTAFPIAKPGYSVIGAAAFATAVVALIGWDILAIAGLVVTFFICWFFRDPDRIIPNEKGAVVSPADGKVIIAGPVDDTRFGMGSCRKISIFMSVFNVHVNRMPCEGKITDIRYFPGKFFNADLDKASQDNEHNAVFSETTEGAAICTVQIAGLIARRIICNIQTGDVLKRGQRFGMICFGSRLDIYLPADTELKVSVGDKVKSGTSIIGYIHQN